MELTGWDFLDKVIDCIPDDAFDGVSLEWLKKTALKSVSVGVVDVLLTMETRDGARSVEGSMNVKIAEDLDVDRTREAWRTVMREMQNLWKESFHDRAAPAKWN